MKQSYEMVIGLEVHVELATQTKIFCGCPTAFGAPPNTQCCPVCAGLPGVLPVLNKQVVEYAIRAGLATHCAIAPVSVNDRKNYFYPDLPKAYQISQLELPLCRGGYVDITTEDGEKRVGVTRIHIEEDAGKLNHDDDAGALIDLNRCGVPLIEIVSEPDMRSAAEALAYLKKLRAIMLYTGISDAKMNEGSFRCDVNLSVRKAGETAMGTRTEMKNLNSFAFIARSIDYEYKRQVQAVEAGEAIEQETRRFDAVSGKTYSMRAKEDANDYRYFPDPDLGAILTDEGTLRRIAQDIPQLPDARRRVYMQQYGLSAYHSEMLVLDKAVADFFEQAAALCAHRQQLASFILSEVFRLMNTGGAETAIAVTPGQLADIVNLLAEGGVNSGGAKKLLAEVWRSGGEPRRLVRALGLEQMNDEGAIAAAAAEVIAENPKMAADYQNGKSAALKALMGLAMAKTGARANPELLQRHLLRALAEGQAPPEQAP